MRVARGSYPADSESSMRRKGRHRHSRVPCGTVETFSPLLRSATVYNWQILSRTTRDNELADKKFGTPWESRILSPRRQRRQRDEERRDEEFQQSKLTVTIT